MQNLHMVEKTVDRDYEDEERRFKTFESKVNRLAGDVKGTLDAIRGAFCYKGALVNECGFLCFGLDVASNHLVAKIVCRGHRNVLRQFGRHVLRFDGLQKESRGNR